MNPRILLIDDHVAVRKGLEQMLGSEFPFAVFGTAATAQKGIEEIERAAWDVAILDLSLREVSGLDLIRRMKDKQPRLSVLIYTMYPEEQFGIRALKAGADGYVTKDVAATEVVRAVKRLLSGARYISPALAERLAQKVTVRAHDKPHELLSNREFIVMRKMASGKSVSQIAADLSLSVKTVSTYRTRILSKLDLKTTAELLRYAIENGFTE